MKKPSLRTLILAALLTAATAFGQAPGIISHQGKITVGGNSFTGTGLFKFALVHTNGTIFTDWSNDGSSTAGGEPTAAVSLVVSRGIFSVNLGDAALANMTAIPAGVFTNSAVYLRTWFDDGTNGAVRLTPDRRITSVGYALSANTAASANSVAATNVTGTLAEAQLSANVALRNASQTFSGHNTFAQDLSLGAHSADYRYLQLGGGNSFGFLYGSWPALGDGIHLGYNYYYDGAGAGHVINAGGASSRLTVSYGSVELATGGIGSPPSPRVIVRDTGNVGIGTSYPDATLDVNGSLRATTLSGDGSGLTGLQVNASQLTGGTLPLSVLPAAVVTNTASGVSLAGSFTGNGASLSNLSSLRLTGPLTLEMGGDPFWVWVGSSVDGGTTTSVAVDVGYAYVVEGVDGLQVIDINDPTNPQRVGGYDTAGNAKGVAVAGNYAYVADGSAGLQVIDISDPANPQRAGGCDTAGLACGVAVAGNYSYVADGSAGLQVIDISDPAAPQRVGGYVTTGIAIGVAVAGNYAYVADYTVGLLVIDISNPTDPQLVSRYNATTGIAYGVAVAGNYAYVADDAAGLLVIDISAPARPQRVGGYDTAGNAWGVAVAGNYVYVADHIAGLQVLKQELEESVASMAGVVRATRFVGDGTMLTGVALRSGGNTFSGNQIVTSGNLGIGRPNPAYPLDMGGGAYCTGTQWQNSSDRDAKEQFTAITPREVLDKVTALPITEWKYKSEPEAIKHLGPVAQDFHAAFGLGDSDRAIGTVDESGVALAAIQGLNEKLEAKNAELEKRLSDKDAELESLKASVAELQAAIRRINQAPK